MVLGVSFFVNLLCSLVPCDSNWGYPNNPAVRDSDIRRVDRNVIFNQQDLKVLTNYGEVEGYLMKSISGKHIVAYEGIPYAEPPIDYLRFRAPVPKKKWKGTLKAHKVSPYCLQMSIPRLSRIIGTEDCLQLNIYLPQEIDEYEKLPVIVWIHGGSFTYGGAQEFGPAYLLEQNIILVTVNYRVGVLGFLSTGDEASPGNYGLKDQAMALEWVQSNIEYFGGDIERITLMGQSAGGVSTHLQMMSNFQKSRSVFRNAISMSGTAFSYWAVQTMKFGMRRTKKFANKAKCPFEANTTTLMACLRKINPVELVSLQKDVLDRAPIYPPIYFGPIIEPEHPEAFLTKSPDELYANKEVAQIPWISSLTKDEGDLPLIFIKGVNRLRSFLRFWPERSSIFLDFKHVLESNETAIDITANKINQYYFEGKNVTQVPLSLVGLVHSDRYFNYGVYKGLKEHQKLATTYSSVFGYKGRFGVEKMFNFKTSDWGVPHTEDVFYIYNSTIFSKGLSTTDPEYMVSQFMVNLVTNFARKGKPVHTADNGRDEEIWEEISNRDNLTFLHINNLVQMELDTFKDRMVFWTTLGLPDMTPWSK